MGNFSRYKCWSAGFMLLVLNLLVIFPAFSQSGDSASADPPGRKQRFYLSVSGAYAILETTIRFETLNGALGLKIKLEDHLGMSKYQTIPVFTGRINIKNRHNIYGLYYYLPRESSYVTKNEFEFNGQIFEVGTEIEAYYNLNSFSLGYMYEIIKDQRVNLGLFVNFYMLYLRSGVSSNLEQLNENFKLIASLPNFGAITYFKLHERFGLSGMISLFFLSLDNFSGAIHTLGGQMDFHLTRWLDLGIGYYLFNVTIEANESQFTGIFNYTYKGPFIGLGFRF
jgi:hypothetical protein